MEVMEEEEKESELELELARVEAAVDTENKASKKAESMSSIQK